MLFDATPAASARALRAHLPALSSVYLIAVTCGSGRMPYASDAPIAALINPVGDSIRSSFRFGVTAATSPRAAASLGRRVGGAALQLYGRLLWLACMLWPRLALKGTRALRTRVRWLRHLRSRPTAKAAAAAQQPDGARSESCASAYARPPPPQPLTTAERVGQLAHASLTCCIVRPALRLSALVVERTAQALPAGRGLSARSAGSDGLVDTASQRGIHVPRLSPARRSTASSSHLQVEGTMRACHSSGGLEALGHAGSGGIGGGHSDSPCTLGRNGGSGGGGGGRHGDGGGGSGSGGGKWDKGVPLLQRGKWWELHVQDADHSLGTALCQESGPMYESVLAVLERLPPLDTREQMRLRAARLSHEAML